MLWVDAGVAAWGDTVVAAVASAVVGGAAPFVALAGDVTATEGFGDAAADVAGVLADFA